MVVYKPMIDPWWQHPNRALQVMTQSSLLLLGLQGLNFLLQSFGYSDNFTLNFQEELSLTFLWTGLYAQITCFPFIVTTFQWKVKDTVNIICNEVKQNPHFWRYTTELNPKCYLSLSWEFIVIICHKQKSWLNRNASIWIHCNFLFI